MAMKDQAGWWKIRAPQFFVQLIIPVCRIRKRGATSASFAMRRRARSHKPRGAASPATILHARKELSHPDQTDRALANLNEAIAVTVVIARWKSVR